MQVGDTDEIRISPASSSPRKSPVPVVIGVVCGEGIRAGDCVVKARQAKMFVDRLLGIIVAVSGSAGQAVNK